MRSYPCGRQRRELPGRADIRDRLLADRDPSDRGNHRRAQRPGCTITFDGTHAFAAAGLLALVFRGLTARVAS